MIKRTKNLTILLAMIIITAVDLIVSDTIACRNGPNYWGMSFPGHGQTPDYYKNPRYPSEFDFGGLPLPSAQDYDGSHYGTHDWIADGAIRSLINPVMNPLGFEDWGWLLDINTALTLYPIWNPNYGDSKSKHITERSYITYLFSTQMPDMRIQKEMTEETRQHYPQKIDIPSEGIIIEDFQNIKSSKWVGQIQQHSYYFNPVRNLNGGYDFIPSYTMPSTKALQLGNAAIKCISNKKKYDKGKEISAMQPEGAAGWLGSMTHYFSDLVIPAHVLKHSTYQEIYNSEYHKWFENQLASCTKWDKSNVLNFGPEITYFSYSLTIIGKTGLIIPLPPNIAVARMASKTISIAYREDGNHQYIPYDGLNHDKSFNSGLYLNNININEMKNWDWKNDIDVNGRNSSNYRFFYEKVEELLCWATYYTACAMQFCYNEGKKKNDDNDPNPDYFVDFPERNTSPAIIPEPDPQRHIEDFFNLSPNLDDKNKISRNFNNIGKLFTTFALLGIPEILRRVIEISF